MPENHPKTAKKIPKILTDASELMNSPECVPALVLFYESSETAQRAVFTLLEYLAAYLMQDENLSIRCFALDISQEKGADRRLYAHFAKEEALPCVLLALPNGESYVANGFFDLDHNEMARYMASLGQGDLFSTQVFPKAKKWIIGHINTYRRAFQAQKADYLNSLKKK